MIQGEPQLYGAYEVASSEVLDQSGETSYADDTTTRLLENAHDACQEAPSPSRDIQRNAANS